LTANTALYASADQAAIKAVFVNRGILEVLSAPGSLGATSSASAVNLTWTDTNTEETGYRIERMARGGSFAEIGTVGVNATGYNDTAVAASTMYSYRVRAYNAEGNSRYANTAATSALPAFSIAGALSYKGGVVQDSVTASSTGSFSFLKSSSPALFIPDNNTTGVTANLDFPQAGTITSVVVGVNLTHTYIGDLEISVLHPTTPRSSCTTAPAAARRTCGRSTRRSPRPQAAWPRCRASLRQARGRSRSATLPVRTLERSTTGTCRSRSMERRPSPSPRREARTASPTCWRARTRSAPRLWPV
jgi:hypothetical protein